MATYRITVLDLDALKTIMGEDFTDASEAYAGKTYTGFTLIEGGMYSGAYQGMVGKEDVIFYEDELKSFEKET